MRITLNSATLLRGALSGNDDPVFFDSQRATNVAPGNPTGVPGVDAFVLARVNAASLATPELQRPTSLALVDLYNSAQGTQWINHTNWMTGRVSTWFGITVSGGRVVKIVLPTNNLAGTIPESIGNPTALTELNLSANNLSR